VESKEIGTIELCSKQYAVELEQITPQWKEKGYYCVQFELTEI